jgi:hypothetical protein
MKALVFLGCMIAGLILPERYHPKIDRALDWSTRGPQAI